MTDKHRIVERMAVTPKHTAYARWNMTQTVVMLALCALCAGTFIALMILRP